MPAEITWDYKIDYLHGRIRHMRTCVFWLDAPADNPALLGSSRSEESIEHIAHTVVGWFGPETAKEDLRAAIAAYLDSMDGVAVANPRHQGGVDKASRAPRQGDPAPAPQLPGYWKPGDTGVEAEDEFPDPQGEPNADDIAPTSEPEDELPEDAGPTRAEWGQSSTEHQEPTVTDKTEATAKTGYSDKAVHSVRAKISQEYAKAHEHGPQESRDLWLEVLRKFEEVVG